VNEHLFRHESGRMIAALTRLFGVHNLALAEDFVQDAFCRALEVWKVRGVPENPGAWLMMTAKNRALDVLRRERTARTFAPELSRMLEAETTIAPMVDEAFADSTIRDEQLRMMFSCCHPRLPEEAQVALVLNILCGFGAGEIAAAFLTSRAAMEKRITRARHTLAGAKRLFDLGAATARILAASPYRVALIASSGWSHAFLTPKNNFLWPDTPADLRMFDALERCDWAAWRGLEAAAVEDSGQQEILNWSCLAGAMSALGRTPQETGFLDTWIFNSSKAFLIAPP